MMVEQWIAYIVIVAIVVLSGLLLKCMSVIGEQSVRIRDLEDMQKSFINNMIKFNDKTKNLEEDSERIKGSIETLNTTVSSITNERKVCNCDHGADICQSGDTDGDAKFKDSSCSPLNIWNELAKISMSKTLDQSGDTDGDSVDIHKDDDPPVPVNEQNLSKEPPLYRWIFPAEQNDTIKCIMGEWYLVVGYIREKVKLDGNPMIYSNDAMWNGYQFITVKGERFDKVLAYIKPPQAGDVMERIVELALKEV